MVKKIHSSETSSDTGSAASGNSLADSVKASAQQIWLAGMGAFAKAQAEGGKVFEALVKEGSHLQRKTQGLAEDKINEVTGKMTAMADTVTAKAGQNWDKLESIFEGRTAKALGKLGVPTAKDVAALTARVSALEAALAKAGTAGKAPAKPAAEAAAKSAAPAKKPAAKRAPRKA